MLFFIGLILGFIFAWRLAHITIANECERLGGFYVNNKTYKCISTEIHKDDV